MKCAACSVDIPYSEGFCGPELSFFCGECFGKENAERIIIKNLMDVHSIEANQEIFRRLSLSSEPFATQLLSEHLSSLDDVNRRASQATSLPIIDEETLKYEIRREVLSKKFYSSLGATLPISDADHEAGFDFIPFMLVNIQRRKEIYFKTSNIYLSIVLFLGITLSVIIVTLGYSLIDESIIGDSKYLRKITTSVDEISHELGQIRDFNRDRSGNMAGAFLSEIESNLRIALDRKNWKKESDQVYSEFNTNITAAMSVNDLAQVIQLCSDRKFINSVDQPSILSSVNDSIVRYINIRDNVISSLKETIPIVQASLTKMDASLQSGNTPIISIIKRLTIGLIVVTFFLAILRYFSNLYKTHLSQTLIADRDDLTIRKFYLAYKSAGDDREQKQIALKLLVGNGASNLSPINQDSDPSQSKESMDLLGKLVDALTKKL